VKLTTYLQLVPRSRKCGSINPLPHTPSWHNVQLVRHKENFAFFYNLSPEWFEKKLLMHILGCSPEITE
jgi:hypothetical protein